MPVDARTAAHCVQSCDTFFNGDTAVDAKGFDGLTKVLTGTGQEFAAGANGAQLTLDMMDQLIDLVLPGKPDALFMSRRTRRKLSSLWTQCIQADPAMDVGSRWESEHRVRPLKHAWSGPPGHAFSVK
jgi:hypothetical protein